MIPSTLSAAFPLTWSRALCLAVACLVPPGALRAAEVPADAFAANVRPTEPQTPAEQAKAFEVPPGFRVELVADEPDINKPFNLAFDALGRLWVTTSIEYPRPAPPDRPARDRLMIFEDFGPDGRARKVTQFASGLNIPTGVYPFRSPGADGRVTWKAVVWSIPRIWLLEDTDGDGAADKKEPLYGPFDYTRDTHGNQSSFRRGFDGWMYATHGYNNDSHVTGRDGNTVDMNSGNTYRLRLDGSRIEHHTWGQVNPFGLAWDPFGNLYSSDCHSEPIYLLLAGGYYPSFGKPDDGLGFAPNMMESIRGSTAIDGISYYADDLWPDEYRDSLFIGDVMTSRVYRDSAIERGSGRVARARPDFVVSKDPWFRPVDTTLGPDGALYIADFYNRIIGHYEVPLSHPGRDRERGRIWRVVRDDKPLRPPALAQDMAGLLDELASPSLPRRMLAMNDLGDRFGTATVPDLRRLLFQPKNANQRLHALWLLNRMDALEDENLLRAARANEPILRVHAMRIAAERARRVASPAGAALRHGFSEALDAAAVESLADRDPQVRRCAAEVIGLRPRLEHLRPLIALRHDTATNDTHLLYTVRQSVRNTLADNGVLEKAIGSKWSEPDLHVLLDVALAVHTPPAAHLLLEHRDLFSKDPAFTQAAFAHIARYGATNDLDTLTRAVASPSITDLDFGAGLFRSIQQGFAQRGATLSGSVREWGTQLANRLLRSTTDSVSWVYQPLDDAAGGANPWSFQKRRCADGTSASLLSSHPLGEQWTGRLRSAPFRAPATLGFYLAGHDGFPGTAHPGKNKVALLDAATGEVLVQAPPPGDDTARKIQWDLAAWKGKSVVLEITDGDAGAVYAWLALGRIEPDVLTLPSIAPADVVGRQVSAAQIAAACGSAAGFPALGSLVQDHFADPSARAAAARAVMEDPLNRAVADLVADTAQPHSWRVRLADAVFAEDTSGREPFLASVWRDSPHRFQVAVAGIAAVRPEFTRDLVDRMTVGTAPAGLLQDRRLRDRLNRAADAETQPLLAKLVNSLPDEDSEVQRLVEQRLLSFGTAQPDIAHGREVFTTACAVCHRVGDQGGLVGPQLNGIGTRGIERLCEDILAPNRNVDHAFLTTVLSLKDGDSVTGLFRREEGDVIVLANSAGAEFSVPGKDVAQRHESSVSLMPANFAEILSPSDFNDLLAFLLAQRGSP